jgi:hypothetical protein
MGVNIVPLLFSLFFASQYEKVRKKEAEDLVSGIGQA